MRGFERSKEVRKLIKLMQPNIKSLNEVEYNFVLEIANRLEWYGAAIKISDKQLFWLRDIKAELVDGIERNGNSEV